MKSAEELFDYLGRSIVGSRPGKMFGWRCYKNGNKPYVFFDESSANAMVFKLLQPDIADAIRKWEGSIFNPAKNGKPMKNWVVISFDHHEVWENYLQLSWRFIQDELLLSGKIR